MNAYQQDLDNALAAISRMDRRQGEVKRLAKDLYMALVKVLTDGPCHHMREAESALRAYENDCIRNNEP